MAEEELGFYDRWGEGEVWCVFLQYIFLMTEQSGVLMNYFLKHINQFEIVIHMAYSSTSRMNIANWDRS